MTKQSKVELESQIKYFFAIEGKERKERNPICEKRKIFAENIETQSCGKAWASEQFRSTDDQIQIEIAWTNSKESRCCCCWYVVVVIVAGVVVLVADIVVVVVDVVVGGGKTVGVAVVTIVAVLELIAHGLTTERALGSVHAKSGLDFFNLGKLYAYCYRFL